MKLETIKEILAHYTVYLVTGILAGVLFATATPTIAVQTAITITLISLVLGTITLILKW